MTITPHLNTYECQQLIQWHASQNNNSMFGLTVNHFGEIECKETKISRKRFMSSIENNQYALCKTVQKRVSALDWDTHSEDILFRTAVKIVAQFAVFALESGFQGRFFQKDWIEARLSHAVHSNDYPEARFWIKKYKDFFPQPISTASPQYSMIAAGNKEISPEIFDLLFPNEAYIKAARLEDSIAAFNERLYFYFLQKGKNPDANTLLSATHSGNLAIVQDLYKARLLHSNLTNAVQSQLLATAFLRGHYEIAEYFVLEGFQLGAADKESLAHFLGEEDSDQLPCLKRYILLTSPLLSELSIILTIAAEHGKESIFAFLVSQGVPIAPTLLLKSAPNIFPQITALFQGIKMPQKECFQVLMEAIWMGREDIVRFLIDQGTNVNALMQLENHDLEEEMSPLMMAAYASPMLVPLLLHAGANRYMTNKNGHTALHFACQSPLCRLAAVPALLKGLTSEQSFAFQATLSEDGKKALDMALDEIKAIPAFIAISSLGLFLDYLLPSYEDLEKILTSTILWEDPSTQYFLFSRLLKNAAPSLSLEAKRSLLKTSIEHLPEAVMPLIFYCTPITQEEFGQLNPFLQISISGFLQEQESASERT